MVTHTANDPTPLPDSATVGRLQRLDRVLFLLMAFAFGGLLYENWIAGTGRIVPLAIGVVLLGVAIFLYGAGKRTGAFDQTTNRHDPEFTEDGQRARRAIDRALIAGIAIIFLALQVLNVFGGRQSAYDILWGAFLFAVGRFSFVAGRRSAPSSGRSESNTSNKFSPAPRLSLAFDLALIMVVVVVSVGSIWSAATFSSNVDPSDTVLGQTR